MSIYHAGRDWANVQQLAQLVTGNGLVNDRVSSTVGLSGSVSSSQHVNGLTVVGATTVPAWVTYGTHQKNAEI
jgi:hypothetical protein